MVQVRIATFNLENLDDKVGDVPTLLERIPFVRPQLQRLRADILLLQEVNGQEREGEPRGLHALRRLVEGTEYEHYDVAHTVTTRNEAFDVRNLVILSRFPIDHSAQYKHVFAPAPRYQRQTADPPDAEARAITWERPLLFATVRLDDGPNDVIHLLNVHLKSRRPTVIPGQMVDRFTWRSNTGWAEGSFISAMKRVGQAVEARMFIDQLFDANPDAFVVMGGDFNADHDEVPVQTIKGEVEATGNPALARRVMVPVEATIPESSRYSLFHRGRGEMLDHLLVSRNMLAYYRGSEIHNEVLHDESIAFSQDDKFPESDHAPVVAEFFIPW